MDITYTEVTAPELAFDTLAIRNSGHEDRAVGLHMTDIIRYVEEHVLKSRPPQANWGDWAVSGDVGFWLEDALARGMAMQKVVGIREEALLRPGGLYVDWGEGIGRVYFTPDGYDMDSRSDWECKATWKSIAKNPPENIWYWQTQWKAYCMGLREWGLGTHTTKFTALYVCGDYKPTRPRLLRGECHYTQEELDRCWVMLMGAARTMIERGVV